MKIGKRAHPESPEEMGLVHHALENPTRREMLILMNAGVLTVEEISQAVGASMIDYQLHRLEIAGLIDVRDGDIVLTESGKAYGALVKEQRDRGGADKT